MVTDTQEEQRKSSQFSSFNAFATAVRHAAEGPVDRRLTRVRAAAGNPGEEAVGADGGYLVPPEFLGFISQVVTEVTGLRVGARVGELLALKWEDIDLKAARVAIRRTLWNGQEGSPKGGRSRRVDLGDDVVAVLTAHRHLRGPYVFCSEDGARLTHSMVKDVVPNACRRAGLAKRLTTHGLRHSFASHLVMRGVTLVAVKELLGHAHISTTMRYAHLAPSATRDAVRLLDSGARMAPPRPQECTPHKAERRREVT